MPRLTTMQRWLWPENDKDGARRKQYAQAREDQADTLADQVIDISNRAVDRESAAAAKVQIDARIWHAGKVRPKKWGEKPGDVHVHGPTLVLSQDRIRALQERKLKALGNSEENAPAEVVSVPLSLEPGA